MKKTKEKIIVNTITSTRVIGTVLMPILFNTLSSGVFLLVVSAILFTDFVDGILARRWGVSTVFGSILDMTADKVFGIVILIVLSTMYPIMTIPLALETIIAGINYKGMMKGTVGKSSELGRIKMWVMGLSIFSLLLTGLGPELIENLKNVKIDKNSLEYLVNSKDITLNVLEEVEKNKDVIKNVAVSSAIISESIVAVDYFIKSIKKVDKDSKIYKIADLIKNKEYIKSILFNEKYYEETKDLPLIKKLIPDNKEI
ncbi:MAG: CDP-alcohol phosphatidyltransferase family protein [Bacilli bacterium]|nr:CDP-alcohol phosphatidyltransferase family protein [Bacilli bacterium]